MSDPGGRKHSMFYALMVLLFLSQLFIIPPGTDLMGIHTRIETITAFAGLTYSSVVSILIILYCVLGFLLNIYARKLDMLLIVMLISYTMLGILIGIANDISSADDGIKMIFPFVIFLFLGTEKLRRPAESFSRLLIMINALLIAQVVACKVIEGSFSASKYYWYIYEEEYFGFFNSPHPFAANLGLMAIWNLYCIQKRRHVKANAVLLPLNLWLIYLSGVKSYLLACLMAIALIVFRYAFARKSAPLTRLSLLIMFLGALGAQYLANMLLETRFFTTTSTINLSSGRDLRWLLDANYYLTEFNPFEKLFGRGFGAVYQINKELIDVEINSLNAILDILLDNGLIGLGLMIGCYSVLIGKLISREDIFFQLCFGLYLMAGIMINNILPYVTVMSLAVIMLYSQKAAAVEQPNLLQERYA